MLSPNWFAAFFRKLSRSSSQLFPQQPGKRKQSASGRCIESLEPRTLLSVRAVIDPSSHELQVTAKHGESITLGTNKHGDLTVNGHRVKNHGPQGKAESNVARIESIVINGGNRANHIDLSGVTDSLFSGLINVEIHGNAGDDTIVGSQFNDTIHGGSGDDVIDGGAGDDSIHGGTGHDDLTGGVGTDEIHGDDGDDSLHGDANDSDDGGAGHNTLVHEPTTHEEPPTHEDPPTHEVPPTHEQLPPHGNGVD